MLYAESSDVVNRAKVATGTDRTTLVRGHILDQLEAGTLQGGDRLPSARHLAAQLDVSFIKVLQAVESLVQDGVLETHPRIGIFVQSDWRSRVLHENLSIFNQVGRLPWIAGVRDILAEELPGLRLTHAFASGIIELKTTLHVQMHHDQYLDLAPVLERCYPDQSQFFAEPFAPFRADGRLVGVPFIFSPRVIFYDPALFARAGCPEPRAGWTWEGFLATVRHLRAALPGIQAISWHTRPYQWLNYVLRAGGRLFDPAAADPVRVDSPATRNGLRCVRELGAVLGRPAWDERAEGAFARGESAMHLGEREVLPSLSRAGIDGWRTVPLPVLPGGSDVTSQATDLICVRRNCVRPELIERYVRVMLSERVQDHVGAQRYGIPVRRSSAVASLDLADPRDALFATEIPKLRGESCAVSPELLRFMFRGVTRLLDEDIDIDQGTAELAAAARTMLAVERHRPGI
jgi:hypothetical protein